MLKQIEVYTAVIDLPFPSPSLFDISSLPSPSLPLLFSPSSSLVLPLLPLGKRPFGVSILYMGWDPHFGFQLYQSDPSGNYGGWKATCVGSNHQAAISLLKQDYKETPCLKDALQLAIKVLHKTLDSAKLNADKGNC